MEKRAYTAPEFEIIILENTDIITDSGGDWDLPPIVGISNPSGSRTSGGWDGEK